MKAEDIKVRVVFTDGYAQRYTEACLKILERRQRQHVLEAMAADAVSTVAVSGLAPGLGGSLPSDHYKPKGPAVACDSAAQISAQAVGC